MSKTLEQVVLALPCDGATTLAIIGALKEAGLADATVYGLCETCGGSRKCKRCDGEGKWFYELELKMIPCDACNGTGACPDCTTVSVVTKGLRERAIELLLEEGAKGFAGPRQQLNFTLVARGAAEDAVDAVLSTVLGKTRVAKEIGYIHDNSSGDPTFYLWAGMETSDVDGYELMKHTIAILEDDDE